MLNLSVRDQPDLSSIEDNYKKPGGNFWIALDDFNEVIGTIALFNLGQNIGDLRKMFVKKEWRGKRLGVADALLKVLLDWCTENKYSKIYLETTSAFAAAIKFYLKNGFTEVQQNELPNNFPIIKVAEFFFVYDICKMKH